MTIEILAPTVCPECSSVIIEDTDSTSGITTHWCQNRNCRGRLRDLLTYVSNRKVLEIDGLGPELATKLVADDFVTNLADLFEFGNDLRVAYDKLDEYLFELQVTQQGFPVALTTAMMFSLEKAKTAAWDRWIAAFGIPSIGERLSKVVAKTLKLEAGGLPMLWLSLTTLKDYGVEGLGPSKLAEIDRIAHDPQFKAVCSRLHAAGVRPTPLTTASVTGTPLAGTAFVVTGEFDNIGSREFITTKLESLGAIAKSGVTKKVNLLIVGSQPGKAKTTKAEALGIKRVDETWLNEVFTANGIEKTGGTIDVESID